MNDLVVLAADNNIRAALDALLQRHEKLGIRPIVFDAYAHPHRDPGVYTTSQEFLRQFLRSHQRALVVFDREGCGSDQVATEIQGSVQRNLDVNGWKDRSCVVVLDPEIEVWVWASSEHVATALGWKDLRSLRRWLREMNFVEQDEQKPRRPKEAMEAALRRVKLPRSTAIYRRIAARVEIENCVDPSLCSLTEQLRIWFPVV